MLQTLISALARQAASARYWRGVLLLLLCVITALALAPVPPKQADLGWDKLNHLCAFGALAAVAFFGRVGGAVRITVGLLAYGVLIEVLQSYTPTRSAEWGDLLADGAGIALGLVFARLVMQMAQRLLDRRRQAA